jgi:hypothetical protein
MPAAHNCSGAAARAHGRLVAHGCMAARGAGPAACGTHVGMAAAPAAWGGDVVSVRQCARGDSGVAH